MCVLQGAGLAATPHTYKKQMVRVLVEVLNSVGRGTCECSRSDLGTIVCVKAQLDLKVR